MHRSFHDRKVKQVRDLSCGDRRVYLEFEVRRLLCKATGLKRQERIEWMSDNPFYGAFSYVAGNNWVFYLSGTSLYCYDLSGANPADCNNTAISIPAQLGNLSVETITRDASNNVYVINSSANLVYKYVP